mmetsp:Transcript_45154/g.116809  ORF Transcript_45154/g.116809 Transcript_45154/m.116809 type:complete len:318 (-) Transcript_45154:92-1045(-)
MSSFQSDVVVVGAGAAGIYTSYLLRRAELKVIVLEARSDIGGRTKTISDFVPWKFEIGAEFIHGANSIPKFEADRLLLNQRRLFPWATGDEPCPKSLVAGGVGLYYVRQNEPGKRLHRFDTRDARIRHLNQVLEEMSDASWSGPDVSIREYLESMGLGTAEVDLANAGFANTLCSHVDALSLQETVRLLKGWEKDGDGQFRIMDGYSEMWRKLSEGIDVRVDHVVTRIDYACRRTASKCTVVCENGDSFGSDVVVVTIPPSQMKKKTIIFNPSLPVPVMQAYSSIETPRAMKVALKMSVPLFSRDVHGVGVVCKSMA